MLQAEAPATTTSGLAQRDWAIAAVLACALLSLYLLTFSGTFRSIDELAFYAITENWNLTGTFQPRLVEFARWHNPIGDFEPGYPLLASGLYAAARLWPRVSQIHAVMLLNPALTAATGAVLYLFVRRLGYERVTGALGAALFGLGTMAWPYTKSFLREPAIGLPWTLAFLGLALFVQRPTWKAALLALAPAVLAVAIKITSIVSWPVIVGLLGWALHRHGKLSRPALLGLLVAGAVAAVGLGLVLLQVRGLGSDDILRILRASVANPFTRAGILPWYGLLFSPGKSVFIYSPVLVLGVLGWPALRRRHPALAVGLAALWVLVLLSLRASVWWGGLVWGPRYLLPLVPLSMLPTLELLRHKAWALAVGGLSVVFQSLVAAVDWSRAYQVLFDRYPGVNPDLAIGMDWTRWTDSPAIQILRVWGWPSLDLVWLHTGLAREIKLDLALVATLAFALLVSGLALAAVWRGWQSRRAVALVFTTLAAATAVLLWRGYNDVTDFPGMTGSAARVLASQVSTGAVRPAAIVYVSPEIWTCPWLGLVKGPATRTWISPSQRDGYDALLPANSGTQLAMVVDWPHMQGQPSGDGVLQWMNAHAYPMGNWWVDDLQVFQYAAVANAGARQQTDIRWPTGVALTEFALPSTIVAGTVLPIDLTFTCLADDWAAYDRLFTNLVGPDGQVIAGQELWLGRGRAVLAGLRAGQTVKERRGLWIPSGAPSAAYTLVVGFANDGGFVQPQLADGTRVDYDELATVQVLPQSGQ